MLPTRGTCHGVFLLLHSARSSARRSLSEWVSFARGMPTLMAAAVDLQAVAHWMCVSGLAKIAATVEIHPRLLSVGTAATDEAFMQIAAAILETDRPPWLQSAFSGGDFVPELIPTRDLSALDWLGDATAPILAAVNEQAQDDGIRKWIGDIGESLVVAIEKARGSAVSQVSLISDYFGYDVESFLARRFRIEVKTSVEGTRHRLFLTRNEMNTAQNFQGEWFLVHVVLKAEALTAAVVEPSHVVETRRLPAPIVLSLLPRDSDQCRWIEAVELLTEGLPWEPYWAKESNPIDWSLAGLAR